MVRDSYLKIIQENWYLMLNLKWKNSGMFGPISFSNMFQYLHESRRTAIFQPIHLLEDKKDMC